jgi:isoleucyl-tRNA synthetase
LLEKRTGELFKDPKEFTVLAKMKGKDLKDKRYTPLFPYFLNQKEKGAFRVLNDTYVTEDSGTGIVHCAPAFGEDDFRVCTEAGIVGHGGQGLVCPVDGSGLFTAEVTDFAGRYVKEADKDIVKKLKEMGRLEKNSSINHSYPFCWR